MRKLAVSALICLFFLDPAWADVKKEAEFLKKKDCKNFFIENSKTKEENEKKYKNKEDKRKAFLGYVLSREANGHEKCNDDLKKSLKLFIKSVKIVESIKRPTSDTLQQLATTYQLLGYNYNKLADIKNGIKFLEKGLRIEEKNFYKKNYKSIARTYNVLGFWYLNIYEYKKAEKYQKKYLEYVKKNKGEFSKEYYNAYTGLALDYRSAGEYDYSLNVYLEIKKKLSNFDIKVLEKILFYRNLSISYGNKENFNLQKENILIALDILNNHKNDFNNEKYTRYEILLNNDLGIIYSNIYNVNGNIENLYVAEKYYLKTIELSRQIKKDDELYINFGNLSALYSSFGNYTKAIEYQIKAVNFCEKVLKKFHPSCLKQMSALGHRYYKNNNYDKAISLYLTAIKNEPKDFGAFQTYRISNRNLLGIIYQAKANYELAEKFLLEGISLWNPEKPQSHLAYFDTLNSLYNLYYVSGRFEESGNGFKELLKFTEKKYGSFSPQLLPPLNGLSLYYQKIGLITDSIKVITRAINIAEKNTPNHPLRPTLYHNLGYAYASEAYASSSLNGLAEDKYRLAEKNFEISLKLRRADEGLDLVITYLELANIKIYFKKFNEVENILNNSRAISDKKLGANHPIKSLLYRRYLELYFHTKKIENYTKVFSELYLLISDHANGTLSKNYSVSKNYFEKDVNSLFDTISIFSEDQYKYLVKNFITHSNIPFNDAIIELSEISRTTTVNVSIKNLIERSKDPQVASIKKEYQNLIIDYEKAKKFSNIVSEKKAIFVNLRNLKNKIFKKKQLLLRTLKLNDQKISNNQISIKKIQSEMKNDEVLISYYFTSNNLHVAIINSLKVEFKTLNTNNKKINNIIKNIRASLELTNDKKLQDFNVFQSRILFNEILNPILKNIENKKNLIIIPHKSLLSMPFELLIDEEGLEKNSDYQNINWLINKFNISYYPSINSFYSLRTVNFQKTSRDFAGFGDPKFVQVAKPESDIRFTNLYLRSGVANQNELRKFEELPETRNELSFLSKVFKNGSDLYLGKDFTEQKVKSLKLDQYKVISFATHAVLANELNNIGEPGIILTPPDVPDEINDGVLTVSEIQKLKLAADTVILSACNTAGKDGSANAEGLSGLASAFFHAGAKSLMVTHWSVETNSAVSIMTNTFKNFENKNSLSQSLTLAKREMIKNKLTSHPMFWAPFVIIGDNPEKI